MMLVSATRRIALIRRTSAELVADPNAFDDQHTILDFDIALGF